MMTRESQTLENTLLAVIDMQPGFLKVIPRSEELSRRCAFAISVAGLVGIPVAFTEQVPAKLGPTDPALLALAPDAATFGKESFAATNDRPFADALANRETTHLIVSGIETPVCVFQTAIGARVLGLEVTVLSDCIGGRRDTDAADALRYMASKGCHVLPSETVFYSVLGTAAHPRFRDYTALVKKFS
jgi:nicotinamidase-related amidase